jgi:hypothetical protein
LRAVSPLAVSAAIVSSGVSCNGATDGEASMVVSGGTGDWTFVWSHGAAAATTTSGLGIGYYTASALDANGCFAESSLILSEPDEVSLELLTEVSCQGGSDGVGTIVPTGGVGGDSCAWSSGDMVATTASGLGAGV